MTDEMIALARRAVACKGWRWMPGMLSHHGERQLWCSETEYEWSSPSFSEAAMDWRRARFAGSRELPDLADPATLGCLLALVREAWRDHIVAKFGNGWWELETDGARWDDATTQSFVEALVAALESAP